MMMWHGNWSSVDWVLVSVGMLVFWAAMIAGILWLVRTTTGDRSNSHPNGVSLDKRAEPGGPTARDILDNRYARGELSDDDYHARCDLLTTR